MPIVALRSVHDEWQHGPFDLDGVDLARPSERHPNEPRLAVPGQELDVDAPRDADRLLMVES